MSSTDIRELLPKRGARELLDEKVYAEIIRCRLYGAQPELAWLREQVKPFLKPKRIPHVLGCEQEAVKLARRWGEDEALAAEAGILHDITKKLDAEEQLRLCEEYAIPLDAEERQQPKLLHARTGAYVARACFGVGDEVFHAIERHTTGCVGMTKLDMIVYLADFIEPTRSFDGLERVRELAYTDLTASVIEAMQLSLQEVRSHGTEPHRHTKDTLQWLKAMR